MLLLEKKKFSDISISELCREAGVSRQIFYSLYESKENIIIDLLQSYNYSPVEAESSTDKVSSEKNKVLFDLSSFCSQFSSYLKNNTNFLKLLAENNILYLLHDSFYSSIICCDFFMEGQLKKEREYTTSFIASGFMGITKTYIEHDGKDEKNI